MNSTELSRMRLASQQIEAGTKPSISDLVAWMGAIQAQDYPMSKWAIGVRLPAASDQSVEAALAAGEIVRIHVLRPTWHLVTAEDAPWLLALTAAHIKATMRSRNAQLGLSDEVFAKSNKVIATALQREQWQTRKQLIAELERNGLAVDENRAWHLLMQAELDGLACGGPQSSGLPTYSAPRQATHPTGQLSRDEALARLASMFFASRGPATLADFVWWSGLPAGDARRGLDMVKAELVSEPLGLRVHWFSAALPQRPAAAQTVHLLPAFDEFIISYTDRSAALTPGQHAKAIANNGVFKPVVEMDGRVLGRWKRTVSRDQVALETALFDQADDATIRLINDAATRYGRFLGKPVTYRSGRQ